MRQITRKELEGILKDFEKGTIEYIDLSNCDLSYMDLTDANLSNAYLRSADLSSADLKGAGLSRADLSNADLSNANLRSANLSNANLNNADLRSADLYSANLSNANLRGANFDSKEQIRLGAILKESIIGYKKCLDNAIVTLEIPVGAIVFSVNNNKCRTNTVKVIKIEDSKGEEISTAVSSYDCNFIYKKGETIVIDDYNLIYNIECGTGIHFFRTRKEAESFKL